MHSRALSLVAIASFILLGTGCLALRYQWRQEALSAREDTVWELIYKTDFKAIVGEGQEQSRVQLPLPFDTLYCQVLSPDAVTRIISNRNLKSEVRGPFKWTRNRVLSLTTRQAGNYEANVKFRLRLSARPIAARSSPLESLAPDARAWYLRDEPHVIPTNKELVRQKLQAIVGDATTQAEKLKLIFAHCLTIDNKASTASDDVIDALTDSRGTALARARTMVTLSRAARVPARLVTGFRIVQGADVKPHVWAEVFHEQAWLPFDPTDGYSFSMPMTYVPVRRGSALDELASDQLVDFRNVAGKPATTFSIRVVEPEPVAQEAAARSPLEIFDLTRLPVPMHRVMKILLLLPFAALITTILRNVVGLATFGTFSPALLAMSFIYADLKTGLAILAIVIAVGLVGRTLLEKLRLLMVPRLSIILTTVILCVVFGISSLHYLLPGISAEVVLLPMVIMTTLIERFHVSAEEDGMAYTLQLAAGTLFVALLCYLVLLDKNVGDFVLTYPETHFFTIAIFIFLGRYAGYRLTELWRFRDVVRNTASEIVP
jgi:hypothetical protein